MLQLSYFGPSYVHGDLPSSFYDRHGNVSWEMFWIRRREDGRSGDEWSDRGRVIVRTTRFCALHLRWWCITRPPSTMGAPILVLWTILRPWRPPIVILWRSRNIPGKCLDQETGRSGDQMEQPWYSERSIGKHRYGCSVLVERCRYVTECMKFDLTFFPSTTDISFVYNTPMPCS